MRAGAHRGWTDHVAATLAAIRTESIGVEPDPAVDGEVAAKIVDWYASVIPK